MCKLYSFKIFIQTSNLTVLAILTKLVVGGGALYCMLPTCLWLCHIGTGHSGPYSSPLRTFRVLNNDWVWKKKSKQ